MIQLDLQNIFELETKNSISKKELSNELEKLQKNIKSLKDKDQGFFEITEDKKTIEKIEKYAKKVKGRYKQILVLGIGGSALGGVCLKKSLTHQYKATSPKLNFLDNIDPTQINELEETLDFKETLFIVITKSGSTPETLALYFYFREKIEGLKLSPKEHFVFVTDPKKGLLREIVKKENITSFEIPQNVGGRFSVLTPVGLLPAALIGINIKKLIAGATINKKTSLSEKPQENLAYKIAAIQYFLYKKGKNINVIMPYSQKLLYFSDWYRQLLAESIGKKLNNKNQEVFTGITPVKALGATDQHSQSQLYNEGPNDKLFIFLKINTFTKKLKIPNLLPEKEELNYLRDLDFQKLIHTELEGTKMSLTQNQRPNLTINIPEVNEENLGALFMLFQAATAYLGELLKINAFNQPGVELSKNLTKKLLTKNQGEK